MALVTRPNTPVAAVFAVVLALVAAASSVLATAVRWVARVLAVFAPVFAVNATVSVAIATCAAFAALAFSRNTAAIPIAL